MHQQIVDAGATLVAISPQLVEYNRQMVEKYTLSFDVLSDQGNQVARRYGLVFKLPDDLQAVYQKFGIDLEKYNGDDAWELPMPARFVLDRDGIVRAVDADPDYTTRPEPSKTVEDLRSLGRSRAGA